MKRTYIAGTGIGGDSLVGNGEDAQAKQFNTWSFDDEEEEEKQSNIWE